jgi:hypothetical protein
MISLSYSRIPEPVPFNPESSGKFEVFKKFRWTGTSGPLKATTLQYATVKLITF